MFRIESQVQTQSDDFRATRAAMEAKLAEFREKLARARAGGPPEQVTRHKERGKLTARERLERLFDRDTPFLEFSALAAHGLYNDEAPAAGIVTSSVTHSSTCSSNAVPSPAATSANPASGPRTPARVSMR